MQAFEIQINENIQNYAVCSKGTAQIEYEFPPPIHKIFEIHLEN